MKKPYAILGALSAAILIAILVFLAPFAQNSEFKPSSTIEQATATHLELAFTATRVPQISTRTLPAPAATIQPTKVVLPPHTVNGYTAAIESYYVDVSHIIFQVRITGGNITFGDEHFYDRIGSPDLYDEHGNMINTSGGWGPAVDPGLYQFEFVPVTLLKGDRIKGQFAFDLENTADHNQKLAQFRFDFDLPIYPEMRIYPKQVVTANGLEMLLDSVTVTPTFTQIYLCFSPPSFAPWTVGSQSVLEMQGQEVALHQSSELFSSATGSYWGARSEPYWVPPVKNGSCFKIGFQAGSNHPTSLSLIIPDLEKLEPDILLTNQLIIDYPGLSEKQAYHKYLEEHGNTHKGPWIFDVELVP